MHAICHVYCHYKVFMEFISVINFNLMDEVDDVGLRFIEQFSFSGERFTLQNVWIVIASFVICLH